MRGNAKKNGRGRAGQGRTGTVRRLKGGTGLIYYSPVDGRATCYIRRPYCSFARVTMQHNALQCDTVQCGAMQSDGSNQSMGQYSCRTPRRAELKAPSLLARHILEDKRAPHLGKG